MACYGDSFTFFFTLLPNSSNRTMVLAFLYQKGVPGIFWGGGGSVADV
jgi:hypothetical protein